MDTHERFEGILSYFFYRYLTVGVISNSKEQKFEFEERDKQAR